MSKRLFAKSMVLQFVLTVVAAAITAVWWDGTAGLAVLVAGAVSTLDLALIATAIRRLASAKPRSRLFYTVALGVKFPVLIGIVYLLVVVLQLHPHGLAIGFSTLVVAVLYASLGYQKSLVRGES